MKRLAKEYKIDAISYCIGNRGRQERGVCALRLIFQHPQGHLMSGMDGIELLRDEGIIFDPSNNPSISHMACS